MSLERKHKSWSAVEMETVANEWRCGRSDVTIGALMTRTASSVRRLRMGMGLVRHARETVTLRLDLPPADVVLERSSREEGDARFQAAMTAAIAAGLEQAKVGVLVDTTPWAARTYRPEPMYSTTGSQALLCAEA